MHRKCLNDIPVTDIFVSNIDNLKEYCKSFNAACNKDSMGFKSILDLNFYDGLTYEHGYVLSLVIDSIGQDVVNKWINTQLIDSEKLKTYLMAGQDWRNSSIENWESVEERYPLIFQ
jgi:hypothetical protein